jgi:hypothetical protein
MKLDARKMYYYAGKDSLHGCRMGNQGLRLRFALRLPKLHRQFGGMRITTESVLRKWFAHL